MTEKLYETDEVASICQVTKETVREWIKDGKIKALPKRGRSYFISESDLMTFLEAKHG